MATEEPIEKTLEYIQERSSNIRRLSKKLKKELVKIWITFNSDYYCRICFQEKELYTNNVINLSDERAKAWINKHAPHDEFLFNPEVQDILIIKPHKFVPCIYVPIAIRDEQPFFTNEEENITYYLYLDRTLQVAAAKDDPYYYYFNVDEIEKLPSPEAIKAMLQRLPKFLEYVASKLSEEESKRKELVEIAEKINAAILQ